MLSGSEVPPIPRVCISITYQKESWSAYARPTSIGGQDHAVSFFVAVCEKEKEEGEPHGIGVCSRKLKEKRALKFGALEH